MTITIASWNVNSVRQRLKGLERFVDARAPDVVCLQETKVDDPQFPLADLEALGYPHIVFHGQKGYNGVAILSRLPIEGESRQVWCGLDDRRHLGVRLPGGVELENFYVPSGGPKPDPEQNDKFAHKLSFLEQMAAWSREVRGDGAKRLLMGDMNVAPLENDVWNHKRLVRSVGHTPMESERFLAILENGALSDLGRRFVPPERPLYTWWGYRFAQSFEKDYGWRLDHALASAALVDAVRGYEVFTETRAWEKPSDHVPVIVTLEA